MNTPQLSASIAGVRIQFQCESPDIGRWIEDFYGPYLTDRDSSYDLRLSIARSATLRGDNEDAEFYKNPQGVVRQRDFRAWALPATGAMPTFAAELSPETEDAVCNLLRWLMPPLLARRGALLLHSAAVIRDGQGYAFFGKSGAGKSTATALIRDADPSVSPVGDDAAIISWEEGRPWLHSAPLGCGYSHSPPPPRRVPLAGLFALKQGSRHALTPCSAAEGLRHLIANSMVADDSHDGRALAAAIPFVEVCPGVQNLEFSRDAGFWDMILQGRAGL